MKDRGFTLIEAVLYLALFSILIGGGVVCAFDLLENAQSGGTRAMLSEETDFLLAKIAWIENDASTISSPAMNANDTVLTVIHPDGTTVSVTLDGSDLKFLRNNETPRSLNNSNVKIENLSFDYHVGSAGIASNIETVLTISARTPNGILLTRIATSTSYLVK